MNCLTNIGIITCSNCTQDLDCASMICLKDLRERKGSFQQYLPEEPLELFGIINCAGSPTVGAQDKISIRVRSFAEFRVEAIHFSYCMIALCPFKEKYAREIQKAYPDVNLVMGTHSPSDPKKFRGDVKEMLCASRVTMADLIKEYSGTP